jgi:hypothetical protein
MATVLLASVRQHLLVYCLEGVAEGELNTALRHLPLHLVLLLQLLHSLVLLPLRLRLLL